MGIIVYIIKKGIYVLNEINSFNFFFNEKFPNSLCIFFCRIFVVIVSRHQILWSLTKYVPDSYITNANLSGNTQTIRIGGKRCDVWIKLRSNQESYMNKPTKTYVIMSNRAVSMWQIVSHEIRYGDLTVSKFNESCAFFNSWFS